VIDAITMLKRKPGLTTDEFQRHWRHEHAELIGHLPGIRRYIQSHPIDREPGGDKPAWDGIAELRAEDTQAFRDIAESDAYVAVLADEETFLDRTATALVLTEEQVIKDGPVAGEGVKCIRLFNRKAGMPVEQFQAHWRDSYGSLIGALPQLDRYVRFPARLGGYKHGRQPECDGFDVTWFPSLDALREAMVSGVAERASSEEQHFLEPANCQQILTREHQILT